MFKIKSRNIIVYIVKIFPLLISELNLTCDFTFIKKASSYNALLQQVLRFTNHILEIDNSSLSDRKLNILTHHYLKHGGSEPDYLMKLKLSK